MSIFRFFILIAVVAMSLTSGNGCWALVGAVDVNGDGMLIATASDNHFAPVDKTTAERPFLFWLNADQDDLELYESWPIGSPDFNDDEPGSLRDLEDLARLMISSSDDLEADLSLVVQWIDTEGTGAIRLWQSADSRCSRRYLEETSAGQAQLTLPYAHTLGVISASNGPIEIPLDLWSAEQRQVGQLCLLFEGVRQGNGSIRLALRSAEGEITVAAPVHLSLRPVKSFYERVAVTWPEDIKAPWTYREQPPEPALEWLPEEMGVPFIRPWYETTDTIVWVHGWIPQDDDNYRRTMVFSFETMWKRLWHQGFRGRVVHFRWPTVKRHEALGLHISEYRAFKSAPQLVSFVDSLPPENRIHVTTHSLGGVLLMEALKLGLDVNAALFQVSAVAAEAFDQSEALVIPNMANILPRDTEHMTHAGYLSETNTPIYNAYNPADFTWFGWNAAQRFEKRIAGFGRRYGHNAGAPEGEHLQLYRFGLKQRPVVDPHEGMASAVPATSQALGGEGRVQGVVAESFNLHEPPYRFESDHVAMWRWNPQKVLPYSNLILDVFDIPYNDAGLAGHLQ